MLDQQLVRPTDELNGTYPGFGSHVNGQAELKCN